MRALRWSPAAEADLGAIEDYLWDIDRSLAEEMIERIREAAEALRPNPMIGPALTSVAVRKWGVRPTSYVLLHRVARSSIEILRVHHAREDWRLE